MTDKPKFDLPRVIHADKQPHPDYGDWHNFLADYTELRDAHHGVLFFGAANCNYIVFPSGLLVQNYGYHGRMLMESVREQGVAAVEAAVKQQKQELKQAVDGLFLREKKQCQDLCAWLQSCALVESAVPVRVSFDEAGRSRKRLQSWFGALYCETHSCQPTERVVAEGPMRDGEILRSYRLYLLGKMFESSRRCDRWVAVYDLPEDRRQPLERCYGPSNEWYTACYWQDTGDTDPVQRLYSPFGRMFMLVLHQSMNFGPYQNYKIDTGEEKPYQRIPMTVKYLDT